MNETTQTLTLEHASAMPAATWGFLNANDTCINVPGGLEIAGDVQVRGACADGAAANAFEQALAREQERWEQAHPELSAEQKAELESYRAAEADATYGGTARSAYQAGADALAEARSLSAAFEQGTGRETAAFLREAAQKRIVIGADAGQSIDAQVIVTARPGAASVAAVDVVAAPSSTVDLSILVDGQDDTVDARDADETGVVGLAGTTVRVYAGESATVNVVRTQALDDGLADIDDMGLFAAESARINVRQTVLGAQQAYAGLAGDLRGDQARIDVDTRYLGWGDQKRDFNYALRHHGRKTECNLMANGVLAGRSAKVLRGTIDLVRGCKGSQGSENETVLLVDEGVTNKTVPVILCNEDDVAGNHGATIGHVRDEQLFYLASRGLSQEDAERMFVGATVEQAAIDAPNDDARASIVRFGETISPGFAELFA